MHKHIFCCALVAIQTLVANQILMATGDDFLTGEEPTAIEHYASFDGITEGNFYNRITCAAIGKKISFFEAVAWTGKHVYDMAPPQNFGRKEILDQPDLLYNTSPCKSTRIPFSPAKHSPINIVAGNVGGKIVDESPMVNKQTGEKKFGIFDHFVLSLRDQGCPIPGAFKHTELFASGALYTKENGKTYYKISAENSNPVPAGKTKAVKAAKKSIKSKK